MDDVEQQQLEKEGNDEIKDRNETESQRTGHIKATSMKRQETLRNVRKTAPPHAMRGRKLLIWDRFHLESGKFPKRVLRLRLSRLWPGREANSWPRRDSRGSERHCESAGFMVAHPSFRENSHRSTKPSAKSQASRGSRHMHRTDFPFVASQV